jgi:hypothetical protein
MKQAHPLAIALGREIFNADFYRRRYPDVEQICGRDEDLNYKVLRQQLEIASWCSSIRLQRFADTCTS